MTTTPIEPIKVVTKRDLHSFPALENQLTINPKKAILGLIKIVYTTTKLTKTTFYRSASIKANTIRDYEELFNQFIKEVGTLGLEAYIAKFQKMPDKRNVQSPAIVATVNVKPIIEKDLYSFTADIKISV